MAIELGDAIWRIGADDSPLRKSISGTSVMIGGAMAAAGAAVTAFAAASVKNFANVGDELAKMSIRTGISVEALSELKHAAELSGTSLASIEKGQRKLSKTIIDAGEGTEAAVQALGYLGLKYKDLAKLSPEDQFFKTAFALAEVKDQTLKVALANELFGKAGTELLPMLKDGAAGLQAMRDEAGELGLRLSNEAGPAAELFNDNLDRMSKVVTGIQYTVAQALLPTLNEWTTWMVEQGKRVIAWVQDHEALVGTITRVAVVMGLMLGGFAPLAVLAPGISVLLGGLAGAFSFLTLPVLGVAAALGAGIFILYQYFQAWGGWEALWVWVTNTIAAAREWLSTNWEQILRIFDNARLIMIEVGEGLARGIDSALKVVQTAFRSLLNVVSPTMTATEAITWDKGASILTNVETMSDGMILSLDRLNQKLDSFLDRVDAFWSKFDWLTDVGTTRIGGMISWFWDKFGPLLTWNPVRDWLFSGGGDMSAPTALATGGTVQQSGWAMVGERGPELVQLPRGATVYDAQQSAGAGGTTVNVTVNGTFDLSDPQTVHKMSEAIGRETAYSLRMAGVFA